jgi:hypothetical protein
MGYQSGPRLHTAFIKTSLLTILLIFGSGLTAGRWADQSQAIREQATGSFCSMIGSRSPGWLWASVPASTKQELQPDSNGNLCLSCHAEAGTSFGKTFHGKISSLESQANKVNCQACHGSGEGHRKW